MGSHARRCQGEKRLWLDICGELSYGLLAKLTCLPLHTVLNHKLLTVWGPSASGRPSRDEALPRTPSGRPRCLPAISRPGTGGGAGGLLCPPSSAAAKAGRRGAERALGQTPPPPRQGARLPARRFPRPPFGRAAGPGRTLVRGPGSQSAAAFIWTLPAPAWALQAEISLRLGRGAPAPPLRQTLPAQEVRLGGLGGVGGRGAIPLPPRPRSRAPVPGRPPGGRRGPAACRPAPLQSCAGGPSARSPAWPAGGCRGLPGGRRAAGWRSLP